MSSTPTDSNPPGWFLAVDLILGSRAFFDEIHRRLATAGHGDLRPAHGFLFQAIGDGATASELAVSLDVTKQAVALMIEELTASGYLERAVDPVDRRRRPVCLTPRGEDALFQSEVIFAELGDEIEGEVGTDRVAATLKTLTFLNERYGPAPLRPVW